MDQRRFLSFIVTAMLFTVLWMAIGPRLFPGLFPPPAARNNPANAAAAANINGEQPNPAIDSPAIEPAELTEFPEQTHTLGSSDPASGYHMEVVLTSAGAAVQSVELNGPKFTEALDRGKPIRIVGNVEKALVNTFAIMANDADPAFKAANASLAKVDWELLQNGLSDSAAAFRYRLPGGLEFTKKFELQKSDDPRAIEGYVLAVDLSVANTTDAPMPLQYAWQGPVGMPLEDRDSTRRFVELQGGFVENEATPTDVTTTSLTADATIDAIDAAAQGQKPLTTGIWRSQLRWAGVDVQYFAALMLVPDGKDTLDFVESTRPTIVARRAKPGGFFSRGPDHTYGDVSLVLETKPTIVPAGAEIVHSFRGFFGPKREQLLEEIHAEGVISFGWFRWISVTLLKVLGFFHDTVGLPYALSIMLLTCCVRLCLMPVTLKAAASAKKMKDLQPKIEELKKKHADDKEALGRAQMELMMKEGNPLGGCLPLFLQMPIFIGLYQALLNTIDLRMARFFWVDNLAAPDHLTKMPFSLPILGDWFNILPLVVVCLFLAQQKLFMPPAVSEEQKQQYKIMNFMMIFMGFMFYSVPAGLCLYFITSSLWGISERTAIDKGWIKTPAKKKKDPNAPKKEGPIRKMINDKVRDLQAQADIARQMQQGQLPPTSAKRDKSQERRIQSRKEQPKDRGKGKGKRKK